MATKKVPSSSWSLGFRKWQGASRVSKPPVGLRTPAGYSMGSKYLSN